MFLFLLQKANLSKKSENSEKGDVVRRGTGLYLCTCEAKKVKKIQNSEKGDVVRRGTGLY